LNEGGKLEGMMSVKEQLKHQSEKYEQLANVSNIQKAVIDELRSALGHAVYRDHPHRDWCDACMEIKRLLAAK
jgi:hypothetical protein